MRKKFDVACTMIYNGHIEISAENEAEAMEIAQYIINNQADGLYPNEIGEFSLGEITVDYAEKIV